MLRACKKKLIMYESTPKADSCTELHFIVCPAKSPAHYCSMLIVMSFRMLLWRPEIGTITKDLVTLIILPQVLHRLQNKEKPIRTTFTLRFGSLKMIFECSIARCDVGLGRAIVQCQKNPLRKPKLSINRAILSAHFSAVKFCIGFFCWIGFFWFCIGFLL